MYLNYILYILCYIYHIYWSNIESKQRQKENIKQNTQSMPWYFNNHEHIVIFSTRVNKIHKQEQHNHLWLKLSRKLEVKKWNWFFLSLLIMFSFKWYQLFYNHVLTFCFLHVLSECYEFNIYVILQIHVLKF